MVGRFTESESNLAQFVQGGDGAELLAAQMALAVAGQEGAKKVKQPVKPKKSEKSSQVRRGY